MMGKVLGIIGGGQLGMMLTEAASRMPEISKVIVLDPTEKCPASQKGAEQIIADFKDETAITRLAERSDVITYEIESGNSTVLKSLEGKTSVNPSPETLQIIQDKLLQKSFLSQNGLPVAEFTSIDSVDHLRVKLNEFGFPALLKARRDAYDGRGNFKIDSPDQIQNAHDFLKGQTLMLERFVRFRMEISVIAARNTKGEIKSFPPVENIHKVNILHQTIAPARISKAITVKAQEIARKTMSVLKGSGVFGIEMFVTKDDSILINEIAPRVHNSGHHTLQSSRTSQFEQHLRAILGMELGDSDLLYPTIMCNILGPKEFQGRYAEPKISEPNVFLKMYGKSVSKPYRKLGHFNLVGKNNESTDQLLEKAIIIKDRISINPDENSK